MRAARRCNLNNMRKVGKDELFEWLKGAEREKSFRRIVDASKSTTVTSFFLHGALAARITWNEDHGRLNVYELGPRPHV